MTPPPLLHVVILSEHFFHRSAAAVASRSIMSCPAGTVACDFRVLLFERKHNDSRGNGPKTKLSTRKAIGWYPNCNCCARVTEHRLAWRLAMQIELCCRN